MQFRCAQLLGRRAALLDGPHLVEGQIEDALQIARRAGRVHRLISAVEIAVVIRHHRVDQALFLPDPLEEA